MSAVTRVTVLATIARYPDGSALLSVSESGSVARVTIDAKQAAALAPVLPGPKTPHNLGMPHRVPGEPRPWLAIREHREETQQ